jgi:hypothetical protein
MAHTDFLPKRRRKESNFTVRNLKNNTATLAR